MQEQRRILITGGRGYLASLLIKKLAENPDVDVIYDLDPRNERTWVEGGKIFHCKGSVLDHGLSKFMRDNSTETCVHAAWAFNPRRNRREQYHLDVQGTRNLFECCLNSGTVKNLFYLGSTTAYGQFTRSATSSLKESDWRYWVNNSLEDDDYQYSIDKAVVDKDMQNWQKLYSKQINIGWIRGAIVLGPNISLENVVAKMALTFGPFMFQVWGYNPWMQFISEHDMTKILYRAVMEKWSGSVNVAGIGHIKYSAIIQELGKKKIVLPLWVLKPMCKLLWKLRAIDFPPEILKLIMYPWVGSIYKLRNEYKYEPWHSSVEAVQQLAQRLTTKKSQSA